MQHVSVKYTYFFMLNSFYYLKIIILLLGTYSYSHIYNPKTKISVKYVY